jgi:SAM-dependent methyltransferase
LDSTTLNNVPPKPTAQEKSRQDFVVALRKFNGTVLGVGNRDVYDASVEPEFVARMGRKPESIAEVRELMLANPYYQFWSAVQRNSQEMVWDSVIDTTERSLFDMIESAKQPLPLGSLTLNPELEIPRYHDAYDIHLQPGGYHTEQVEDDVAAGVIYDLGVPIYSGRAMGESNDAIGRTVVNACKSLFPEVTPERVLDLGCAIGNSTMPWVLEFPEAEVHGVDVAAPCLRYGHLRANKLGETLHLSQQNSEELSFPDDHFDVVASGLMFHETSTSAVPRILKEVFRVLKPGGVMVHFDGFTIAGSDPFMDFLMLWEVYNNNESFLLALQSIDVVQLAEDCGFEDAGFASVPFAPTALSGKKRGKEGYGTGSVWADVDVLVGRKPL